MVPVPRAHPWKELYYGDLGDHRAEELTSIALAPALIPARNPPANEVTEAARKYRDKCIEERLWAACVYKEAQAVATGQNPVAEWVKVITKPGDVLSGAGVTTEGRLLPWSCIPKLEKLSTPPDVFILMAMLLTAEDAETGGRATRDEIVALMKLVKGQKLVMPPEAKDHMRKYRKMEKDVKTICSSSDLNVGPMSPTKATTQQATEKGERRPETARSSSDLDGSALSEGEDDQGERGDAAEGGGGLAFTSRRK
ncbi:hypothetical protein FRC01_013883 [Tulasnella sp. 417]|nr:hypothetical protein FRC01_013883 [Tulasnella sp. 417]